MYETPTKYEYNYIIHKLSTYFIIIRVFDNATFNEKDLEVEASPCQLSEELEEEAVQEV